MQSGASERYRSDAGNDSEYVRDLAVSVVLQGFRKVPFACVMRYQQDPRQMWKFLHKPYRATHMFSKAIGSHCWPQRNTPASWGTRMSQWGMFADRAGQKEEMFDR